MKTTNNLFLIGFMGAGKSSVSAALGKKLGWNVIEMDERIAADEGMSIPEIFAQNAEPALLAFRRQNMNQLRRACRVGVCVAVNLHTFLARQFHPAQHVWR